jgi:hypothetical protein
MSNAGELDMRDVGIHTVILARLRADERRAHQLRIAREERTPNRCRERGVPVDEDAFKLLLDDQALAATLRP